MKAWAEEFERDGFLALRSYFPADEIERAITAIDEVLQTRPAEVVVDDLAINERTFLTSARDPEEGRFKYNDLYLLLDELRSLALAPELSALLTALLGGRRPVLCYSLTFQHGSGQPIHIDSLYMTPKTQSHLLATWVALEDVHPDAGPLIYYPGSHKIPLYTFQDGTHHARQEEMESWSAYIRAEMERRGIEGRTFLARKGDLFIWHSDLVHGGSEIGDPTKTRRSLVYHYFTEADCRRNKHSQLEELNGALWLNRLPPPVYIRRQSDSAPTVHSRRKFTSGGIPTFARLWRAAVCPLPSTTISTTASPRSGQSETRPAATRIASCPFREQLRQRSPSSRTAFAEFPALGSS